MPFVVFSRTHAELTISSHHKKPFWQKVFVFCELLRARLRAGHCGTIIEFNEHLMEFHLPKWMYHEKTNL